MPKREFSVQETWNMQNNNKTKVSGYQKKSFKELTTLFTSQKEQLVKTRRRLQEGNFKKEMLKDNPETKFYNLALPRMRAVSFSYKRSIAASIEAHTIRDKYLNQALTCVTTILK